MKNREQILTEMKSLISKAEKLVNLTNSALDKATIENQNLKDFKSDNLNEFELQERKEVLVKSMSRNRRRLNTATKRINECAQLLYQAQSLKHTIDIPASY